MYGNSTGSEWPKADEHDDQERGEKVLHQRISIGDHWVDSRLEVPIMIQVIFGLQELKGLVDLL